MAFADILPHGRVIIHFQNCSVKVDKTQFVYYKKMQPAKVYLLIKVIHNKEPHKLVSSPLSRTWSCKFHHDLLIWPITVITCLETTQNGFRSLLQYPVAEMLIDILLTWGTFQENVNLLILSRKGLKRFTTST